ncbi:MAG: hybrid sensor histidine kinase/response regulator [Elusimicrobia bacterium]|nr:hybrid sensor histidine kinase/response regulator [Elusimicrobiota bacterium]
MPKILIVDDTVEIAATLKFTLQQSGYDASICYSGKEVLARIAEDRPDVVMLDVMMPGLNGFDVCRLLKDDPATREIPVIMLSALKEVEDKVRGLDCGADDFLTKPCRDLEVLARLRAHLRVKELHEELKASHEELKKLSALKDNLTQLIVHDLKNPLFSAKGWLELMYKGKAGELNEKQKEFVERVMRSYDLGLDMVNDLMDVMMMEDSRLQLRKAPVDAGELVDGCLKHMEIYFLHQEVSARKRIGAGIRPLNADGQLIRRVILNLMGNSLKFTPRGGAVSVTAKHSRKDRRSVFSVADTGRGIPPEYLGRIFEKFFKVEGSAAVPTHSFGKGMGLTFCKLAVESHGGTIWAESEPGKGTTISFTLPDGE